MRLRIPPNLVTLFGFLAAVGAAGAAWAGGGWRWLVVGLVVISGLLDNIDGAVAMLSDRVTSWGHVLDSVVDRCCDGLYLVTFWAVGAPGVVCVAAGAAMGLAEYVRARAGVAGMTEVGVVTVFERPTRVIVTAAFVLAATIFSAAWTTVGAWVWLGLAAVGLTQLLVVVRRRLR